MVLVDHGLYKEIDDKFRIRYAQLWKSLMLADLNRVDEARAYLEEILLRADHSASHYSVLHKDWLTKSKNLLKTI